MHTTLIDFRADLHFVEHFRKLKVLNNEMSPPILKALEEAGAPSGNFYYHVLAFRLELAMSGDFLTWPMRMVGALFLFLI